MAHLPVSTEPTPQWIQRQSGSDTTDRGRAHLEPAPMRQLRCPLSRSYLVISNSFSLSRLSEKNCQRQPFLLLYFE